MNGFLTGLKGAESLYFIAFYTFACYWTVNKWIDVKKMMYKHLNPHIHQCAVSFPFALCYNYLANILTLFCQLVRNMVFSYKPRPGRARRNSAIFQSWSASDGLTGGRLR